MIVGILINNIIILNIKILIAVLVTMSITLLMAVIITYIFKKKILGKAYELLNESDISTNASKLSSALINGTKNDIANYTEKTTKSVLLKILNSQARLWTTRTIMSIFGILGACFATLLAIQQNELIDNQNNYFIEIDKPELSMNTHALKWDDKGDMILISLDLNLENIGKRPAKQIDYELFFYDYLESEGSLNLLDSLKETFSTDLKKNNEINLNSMCAKDDNGKELLVYFKCKYVDVVNKIARIDSIEFNYKIPLPASDPKYGHALMMGKMKEYELITNYRKSM